MLFNIFPRLVKPKRAAVRDGDILWKRGFSEALSVTESLELAQQAVFKSAQPSMRAAKTMCRRAWDMNGPSYEVRELIRKTISRFASSSDKHIEYLRVLKAAVALEASDVSDAINTCRPALNADENAQMRMPAALVAALHQGDVLDTRWSHLCVQALARASEAERALLAIFADTSLRICLVGNSPCEKGRKSGKQIDDHDVVIRFNNFEASSDFADDYGRKTTIWARARGNVDMWRRPYSQFSHVIFTGSDLRYHAATAYDVVDAYNEGGSPAFVPARVYSKLTQELDNQPSAGLAIAYWLKQYRGSPDGKNFSIYGMALDDQEPTRSSQYFNNKLSRSRYAHNWTREAAFFRERIIGA